MPDLHKHIGTKLKVKPDKLPPKIISCKYQKKLIVKDLTIKFNLVTSILIRIVLALESSE